jgi:serine/threonine protein kinase
MIGRRLGHFEILSLLGEGGMGAVYKARDTHLDRLVALKVLPHDKMADEERKRRFSHEAKAASALNHPNIVTIYDIAADDGIDFIAMEYVEGRTLEALLHAGSLPVPEAVKYARQIADGLAAAHSAGILHRDLKPANIMVRDNGLVKLLDFGLAKLADPTDTSESQATRTLALTRVGTVMGTVAYMSPEQAEGKRLDFRSDIFSFGVVVYEMLAGKRAFAGDSEASVVASLLRDEPRPIPELRADVPQELEHLVTRCLRKDPDRRVQTMADVKAALEDLPAVTRTAVSAPIATPLPPPPPPAQQPQYTGPELPPARRERPRRSPWRYSWIVALAFILGPKLLRDFRNAIAPETAAHQESPVALSAAPLTTGPGIARTPTLSPDGTQCAYSWNSSIYITPVPDGAPRRLTTDASDDVAPAWSPDGATIAFLRHHGDTDQILAIPAAGGIERHIAETAHRDGNSLAWTSDSQRLIFPDAPTPDTPVALYELTLATGAKRRVVKPGHSSQDLYPAVSPDGSTVAFARQSDPDRSEIFAAEIPDSGDSDSEPRRLTSLGALSVHPAFTPNGEQIVFSSGASGLWRVPADGGSKPQRLAGIGSGGQAPSIALKAGRLVYSKPDGKNASLWLVDPLR